MRDFMGREPYGIVYELDPESNQYAVGINVRERPPPQWSPIIGDIVHNFEAVPCGPDPRMDAHVKVMCEVAFGGGSLLHGLWIDQTLSAIGLYISDVILEFKSRFDEQP